MLTFEHICDVVDTTLLNVQGLDNYIDLNGLLRGVFYQLDEFFCQDPQRIVLSGFADLSSCEGSTLLPRHHAITILKLHPFLGIDVYGEHVAHGRLVGEYRSS